jgi:hypothetical protein
LLIYSGGVAVAHKIFANYSKSENKEKSHQISEKKDTFNYRKNPLALSRCLGNLTINRLIESQGNVENKQQNDLNMQGVSPEENIVNMLSAFRKQYGISTPNDPVEHEAESVAKQIVNMKTPDSGQSQGVIDNDSNVWKTPKISRKHQASQNTQNTVNLDLPKSDGQPLERSVSEYMEPRFGYSFQDVRIHTSSQSTDISHSLNARAFTTGKDIYFGHGEYNPRSNEGKKLIAHELTHVVQQGQAGQINNDAISRVKKGKPKKTVSLHINHLEKGPASHASDLSKAVDTFKVADVEIKEVKSFTFDDDNTKSLIGNDYILDEYASVGKPTPEEKKLTSEADGHSAGAISVYYVKSMSRGNTGESFWPKDWPTINPSVVVTSKDTKETFSHELGHVLLNDGGHHPNKDNLMFQPNFKFNLDATQRTKIYNSSLAK